MKRSHTIICCLLFVNTLAFAADWETIKGNGKIVAKTRTVTGFQKISNSGSIDIVIEQNNQEGVSIETDENIQDLIVTEVTDGTLKIAFKKNTSANPTKAIVHINCKTLNAISSSGSGDIQSTSSIKTEQLTISHSGSGDSKLKLAVNELKINTSGSGDFKLEGSATNFTYSGVGSGDVMAKDLNCPAAVVSIAGSGDVVLKNGIKAKVSSVGSGDVSYE